MVPTVQNSLMRGKFIESCHYFAAVLRIRIRIRRIHMFLDLPHPDPLVRDADPDPSIINKKKTLIPTVLSLLYDVFFEK
jgi:hypothetical protein